MDGVSGRLVPASDPVALAGAIRELLVDEELARRMAHAGQERALSRFSSAVMVERVTGVYRSLLEPRAVRLAARG